MMTITFLIALVVTVFCFELVSLVIERRITRPIAYIERVKPFVRIKVQYTVGDAAREIKVREGLRLNVR